MTVRVKVCGITNISDARAAIAAGADLLGFIFAHESPRYVTPLQVCRILAEAQPGRSGVRTVGVFVNEPTETVAHVLAFCGLDLAQLHGEEPAGDLGAAVGGSGLLRGRAYKGLRPRTLEEALDLARVYAVPAGLGAGETMPALLVDSYRPDRRGGTGAVADWTLAARVSKRYPLLLAGGLSPTNVAEAVRMVRPWGVDVSSGVESQPGRKDHDALRSFIEAARSGIQE